ncbi:MAG: glycosyltransferase family 9 protein [Bacteroidetes bacterium]|nr:glycosyltransferase family 9 protein [Bacteroidota bacterium]
MPAKLLIIRFSSIGDIVLTTPVIRCLKEQVHDGCEIHYITREPFVPLLKANPYITKIYSVRQTTAEVIRELKDEHFDYIIDLHHNLRSTRLKMKLSRLSFSVNKINIQKWLMVNFKINVLPQKHIVDRYLETVKSFGIVNDGKGLDYFIPQEDDVEITSLPETHRNGFIGFAIGAKYATKRLPVEKIIAICRLISKPVILMGGMEDRDRGDEIVKNSGQHVFNGCGIYWLNQTASLIRQAEKIISHDTGLMHIAAAFKKPIISIWGNTIPEFGMYPYYGDFIIRNYKSEIRNLPCRPCSKLGFRRCPKGHFKCMNLINEREVADWVNE